MERKELHTSRLASQLANVLNCDLHLMYAYLYGMCEQEPPAKYLTIPIRICPCTLLAAFDAAAAPLFIIAKGGKYRYTLQLKWICTVCVCECIEEQEEVMSQQVTGLEE